MLVTSQFGSLVTSSLWRRNLIQTHGGITARALLRSEISSICATALLRPVFPGKNLNSKRSRALKNLEPYRAEGFFF